MARWKKHNPACFNCPGGGGGDPPGGGPCPDGTVERSYYDAFDVDNPGWIKTHNPGWVGGGRLYFIDQNNRPTDWQKPLTRFRRWQCRDFNTSIPPSSALVRQSYLVNIKRLEDMKFTPGTPSSGGVGSWSQSVHSYFNFRNGTNPPYFDYDFSCEWGGAIFENGFQRSSMQFKCQEHPPFSPELHHILYTGLPFELDTDYTIGFKLTYDGLTLPVQMRMAIEFDGAEAGYTRMIEFDPPPSCAANHGFGVWPNTVQGDIHPPSSISYVDDYHFQVELDGGEY